uniref:hypothetical protein n=1 Tax=Salmonella sp. TaxID=599 RepID=UPI001CD950B9|nr:hypothetical protein [Salmonella sp.]
MVTIIRKRPRPRRMTSLQNRAEKKARRKAHTSVANINRKINAHSQKTRFVATQAACKGGLYPGE